MGLEERLSFRATGQICLRFQFHRFAAAGKGMHAGRQALWQAQSPARPRSSFDHPVRSAVSRMLISADALWENGFGIAFPELAGEPSFEDVAATLDRIEALVLLQVIPGHGRFFHDVVQRPGHSSPSA